MLSVEKLSPGPIGSGTQFRVQMKPGAPMLLEFTTFERPVRLGSHTSFSGVTIDGELTFEGRGDSTLMVWDWNITPSGGVSPRRRRLWRPSGALTSASSGRRKVDCGREARDRRSCATRYAVSGVH